MPLSIEAFKSLPGTGTGNRADEVVQLCTEQALSQAEIAQALSLSAGRTNAILKDLVTSGRLVRKRFGRGFAYMANGQ